MRACGLKLTAFSIVATLILAAVGCSKLQTNKPGSIEPLPQLPPMNDAVFPQPQSQTVYPHPSQWNNGHIEFLTRVDAQSKQGDVVRNRCYQCHSGPGKLNGHSERMEKVSCAGSCHKSGGEARKPQDSKSFPVANCAGCHDEFNDLHASDNFTHYPARANMCWMCHKLQPNYEDNAGQGADKHVGIAGPEACAKCHGNKLTGKNVHPIIELEGCGACHNPHGSKTNDGPDQTKLFFRIKKDAAGGTTIQKLCYSCHNGTRAPAPSSKHPTITPQLECLKCHDPHSSNLKYLFKHNAMSGKCCDCHSGFCR